MKVGALLADMRVEKGEGGPRWRRGEEEGKRWERKGVN
jgi:hypothetical protein